MGRGAAFHTTSLSVPAPPEDQTAPLLAQLVNRVKALEKRPSGGIRKEEAEVIFDVVERAITTREARLRKELTDIHTNTLADIRTAMKKLESLGAVSFDSSVALVKQSVNAFVGE